MVVINDPHSSIDLGNFFPMRHFSRAIVLDRFEFEGVAIFSLELVTPMLEEIADLSDFDLFVILRVNKMEYFIQGVFHDKSIRLAVISILLNFHFNKEGGGLP